jgi:N-acetylneuraminic acid mutarotase
VTIDGARFLIGGDVTSPGTPSEGLLLNSRMVHAIFDDENPDTAALWAYPDTGVWDPDRNTDEFVAALPAYAAMGLHAVTVGLQGGRPVPNDHPLADAQPWIVTAFNPDGSLKPAWMARLARVLAAADANGMAVILNLFYNAQEHHLTDENAVRAAIDNTVDWLLANDHTNVLVEVGNETSGASKWVHPILRTGKIGQLIARVQSRSAGSLAASTSFAGGVIPPDGIISQADFLLVHGNGKSAAGIASMVSEIKTRPAYQADPKPIVFNEDSTTVANLDAAVAAGASWGYFDKGLNNYADGFQSPPIDWTINTAAKTAFFDRVAQHTLPSLAFAPSSVVLEVTTGGSPVSQASSLTASDGTAPDYSVTETSSWLSVDPAAGVAPAAIVVTADPTGLDVGDHSAIVTASAPGYASATLAVTLSVTGPLFFEPETLSFSAITDGAAASQPLDLLTAGGSPLDFTVGTDAPWLTVAPASGSAPVTLTVTADPAGLAPGSYSASVTAATSGGETATALVSLTVTGSFGSWAPGAPLPVAILDGGGATVDGSVYVVAGKTSAGRRKTLYAYDPATSSWATKANLPRSYPSVESPAATGFDGRLYVFGGQTAASSGARTSAAVYTPSTNSWAMIAPMPIGRGGATADVVGSKIYVVGGLDPSGASLATVSVYDPATGAWSAAASMSTRRDNAVSAVIDGRLYVFGGRTRNADGTTVSSMLSSVEMYDPATDAWTPRASMPTGRRTAMVGTLNGKAQVIGGEKTSSGGAFTVNEEYDPATDTWRTLTPMPGPRRAAAAATAGGIVYVVGGSTNGGNAYSTKNERFSF